MSKRYIFFLIIAILLLYFNSLNSPFMYDDNYTIVENYYIKNFSNLNYIFTKNYFLYFAETTYRPLVTLSYFIDYYFYKLNPTGYHINNILFHTLSCILIYFLLFHTTGNFALSSLTSIFYALHPIQTEPVNSISFREDLMAQFFSLLCIFSFVKMKDKKHLKKYLAYLISLFSFTLSIFSKESAIITPLVLILYNFLLEEKDIKEILKQKYFYFGFFIILIFYFYITRFVLYVPSSINYPGDSLFVTFLTMSKVFIYYIYNLLFPVSLSADYVIPLSYSMFEPKVFFSIIIIITIFILGIVLYKRHKLVSFGIFYFYITLIPVSNIIPFGHLMNDRYLYMPSLGFFIVLSYLLIKLFRNKVKLLSTAIFILLFYSTFTIKQNIIWQDEMRLWKNAEKKFPDSYNANYGLGCLYTAKSDYEKGLTYLQKAVNLNPTLAKPYAHIGIIYAGKGLFDKSLQYYDKALQLDPNYTKAWINRGMLYYDRGKYDEAINNYNQAIKLDPKNANAYNNRGNAYAMKKLYKKAIDDFSRAIELNPELAPAYKNRGISYLYLGLKELAIDDFIKAEHLGWKILEDLTNYKK